MTPKDPASLAQAEAPSRVMPMVKIGLIIGGLLAVSLFDTELSQWIAANQIRPLKEAAGQISRWGDWIPLALTTIGGLALAIFRRHSRWQRLLLLMLAASIFAGAVVNPLRLVTARVRPNVTVQEQGWHGPAAWAKDDFRFRHHSSFPSAHTAVAFAFATPLLLFTRVFGLPALLLSISVAWARLYLNVHHLSDVCVGAVIGIVCGIFLCRSTVVHYLSGCLLAVLGRFARASRPADAASAPRLMAAQWEA